MALDLAFATIVPGDDYFIADNRQFVQTYGSVADLTGATVQLMIFSRGAGLLFSVNSTHVYSPAANPLVIFELSSSQTMQLLNNGVGYYYSVLATLADTHIITLEQNTLQVEGVNTDNKVDGMRVGLSGYSGSQGTSGFSGVSAGVLGISGYSGVAGSPGAAGSQGISGFSGINGVVGSNGANGASGFSGLAGSAGQSGFSGGTGSQGSQGISGFSGLNGSASSSGFSGATGATGSQGAQGLSGFSGGTGSQGTQGSQGISGFSGLAGSAGSAGSQGSSGFSGLSGISGFSGNYSTSWVTLTDASSVATNASLGNDFKLTIGGNRTLANPTNPKDGQIIRWQIKQDGTGSRTIALDTKFIAGPFGTITLSTTANAVDFLGVIYDQSIDRFYVIVFLPQSTTALGYSGFSGIGSSGFSGVGTAGTSGFSGKVPNPIIAGVLTASTSGSSVSTDASQGNAMNITASASFTLSNPTNSVDQQKFTWRIYNSSGSSITVTPGSNFRFGDVITSLETIDAGGIYYIVASYDTMNSATKWDVLGASQF